MRRDGLFAAVPEETNMTLPEFLRFLSPGWWLVHVLVTAIVYMLGIGRGRRLERRDRERRGESPERKD